MHVDDVPVATGPAGQPPGLPVLPAVPRPATGRRAGGSRRSMLLQTAPTASTAGGLAMIVVVTAIYLGSDRLRNFDPALIGYATAAVFLAFGIAYRFVFWVSNPPARRYFLRGWAATLAPGTLLWTPTRVPRLLSSTLVFQRFIAQRSRPRWLAHQAMFWGVVLAAAMTFPLTFGWIHFRAASGTTQGYAIFVLGHQAMTFDALSWLGWIVFHTLDIAAVLVIVGAGYFFVHRLADRPVVPGQRGVREFLPLVALLAISVTGLGLTASTALLAGRFYHLLALVHMATVVLTLAFIPFGKFFHVIQRVASAGVPAYKEASLQDAGVFRCRVCDAPLEDGAFVKDLQATMGDLALAYPGWVETCPRCKRVARGAAYRTHLKAGFQ